MDRTADLRATSDLLLLDLEALGELEEQKRSIPHGDPKLVDLAAQIEALARRVLNGSQRQRQLTETISEAAVEGNAEPTATIEETRTASQIIAEWREAERRAQAAAWGSRDRAAAEAEIERLRAEYRRAFEGARRPPLDQ